MNRSPHTPLMARPGGSSPSLLTSHASRLRAATGALVLCAKADAIAREIEVEITSGTDDHQLFVLLEQRTVMLQDLTEQLNTLRLELPSAGSAPVPEADRHMDAAEAVVAEVCGAVATSHHITVELAATIGRRREAIRAELDAVQRSSTASVAYGTPTGAPLMDRVR